jgi:RNA polymerase-associated protein RTF1
MARITGSQSDITAMLARKNQLQAKTTTLSTLDRSMLIQQRTLAIRRQDFAEVAEIDEKLAADAAKQQSSARHEGVDLLARVNERNRKANVEAVRKAELEGAERKRRDRKLAQEKGVAGPIDPSARLKITPRTFTAANTPTSTRSVCVFLCCGR